jgi:hypothetical protein
MAMPRLSAASSACGETPPNTRAITSDLIAIAAHLGEVAHRARLRIVHQPVEEVDEERRWNTVLLGHLGKAGAKVGALGGELATPGEPGAPHRQLILNSALAAAGLWLVHEVVERAEEAIEDDDGAPLLRRHEARGEMKGASMRRQQSTDLLIKERRALCLIDCSHGGGCCWKQ